MHWIKATSAAMLLGLAIPAISHADPFDAKRVPADAKWVLHIDMDSARDSKTWAAVEKALDKNDQFQDKVAQVATITGMQFPQGLHDATLYGRSSAEEAGVIIVHGDINHDTTVAAVQMNPSYSSKAYGDYEILSWEDKGKTLYGAFHGASTVVIGHSEANIQAALDTMDSKAECIKDTSPLAQGAKPQLLMYIAAKDLPELKKDNQAQSPLIKRIDTAWVAISEKDNNTVLKADLVAKSPESASQIQKTQIGIKGMVDLAASTDDADPKVKLASDALSTLNLTVKDKDINVDWSIPMDLVGKFIDMAAHDANAKATTPDTAPVAPQ